jgi:hypothetical protein
MLIRSFNSIQELDNNELKDCGILDYKRNICVLVNPNEYKYKMVKRGKAVIINESVSKGSGEGNMTHIKVENSVLIRISAYFCDILFEVPNNIHSSQIAVESAYSKEYQSLFDNNNTAIYLVGNYSNELAKIELTNTEAYYDIINNMDTAVIPPLYYTEKHQYKHTSNIFSMGGSTSEIYCGDELIDNRTRIVFTDINYWDSMRLKILGLMYQAEKNVGNTLDIANSLYYDFTHFIGEEATFIYDSDAKGVNKPGVNIIGGKIPLKPYYTPSYLPENVSTTLSLFEQTCHDIENTYGNIRVQCYPSKIGNKMRIKFKDFETFPLDAKPLGNINTEGGSSSIDIGYQVENIINEAIELNT